MAVDLIVDVDAPPSQRINSVSSEGVQSRLEIEEMFFDHSRLVPIAATIWSSREWMEDEMSWQAPQFIELEMNAEIGAYQQDSRDRGPDRLREERAAPPAPEAEDATPAPAG